MTEQNEISKIPFFFVVGRARSGTTLLRCIFDAHPQIVFPLECAFMIHLRSKYGKITFWDEKQLRDFYNDLLCYPKFHFWTLDREKLLDELLQLKGEQSYSTVCKTVYYQFTSVFPKEKIRLIGDKNPSYSLYIKQLIGLFPEARFIHITRDYRDNIISMIRARFETKIFSSLASRWKYVNRQIDKQKKRFPERFYTLRYEDLVSDPAYCMKELCDFLGVDFSPSMLNYREKLDELLAIYPVDLINLHHKSLLKPINTDKLYEWKKVLTPKEIRICDTVMGSYAEENGYERMFRKRNLLLYLACLPGMLYGRLLFFFMRIIHKMPLGFQMKIVNLLASIFKHDWKRFRRKQ